MGGLVYGAIIWLCSQQRVTMVQGGFIWLCGPPRAAAAEGLAPCTGHPQRARKQVQQDPLHTC